MSGRSKTFRAKAQTPSRSTRAGLNFPVGRVHRQLRESGYARRITGDAPVYLAAVLEYICTEILDLAGNVTYDLKKARIKPDFVNLAVRNDAELDELFKNAHIPQSTVRPHIHRALLTKHDQSKLNAHVSTFNAAVSKKKLENEKPKKKAIGKGC
uniref:Histone H2A n=1 Tax=Panagrellus redivivus TaxID=6233 RepID=A0A7E4W7H4_PANRE